MKIFTLLVAISLLAALSSVKADDNKSTAATQFSSLEKRIGSRIGLSAIDPSHDCHIEYRAQERFPMCSTFKVLAVAAILKRVDENKEKLDRFINYGQAQLLEYAPVTRAHVNEGGMTLEALCVAAVTQSDNTAANLLLEAIGGPKGVTEVARALGDETTHLDRMEPELNNLVEGDERDTTTAAAMCRDLEKLLTSDFLSKDSRTRLEGWMRGNETGLQMIRASAPSGWLVGDKTGRSSDGATNDIAILRPPDGGPIFIAIYLRAPKEASEARAHLVAEVAKIALAELAR